MSEFLQQLNPQQRKACELVYGPILINAGAGSGKTRVLTNRVAHMITAENIAPYNVLAITFTNKAAEEMQERIRNTLGDVAKYIWISTFHSMCAKILRINAEYIGYSNAFAIIDDDDQLRIIKRIMKEKGYSLSMYNPKLIRNVINKMKYGEPLSEEITGDLKLIIDLVYKEYIEVTKQDDQMDFQDLLLNTVKLFEENEEVLDKYRQKFQFILVDEFQDTNNIQYSIVHLLAKEHKNIFVVGDADQSIYAFRGANMNNLGSKFLEDYPDCTIVNLEQNYRSTQMILNSANNVIDHNKNRIKKELWTSREGGEKITYYRSATSSEEVAFVATEIQKLTYMNYEFSDIAILYRNNVMSRAYEDLFLKMKIPFKIHGGFSFYQRREVKDIIAFLRMIVRPEDNYSLERTLNIPKRGIGPKTIKKLRDYSYDKHISMYESLDSANEIFGPSVVQKFQDYKETIQLIQSEMKHTKKLTKMVDVILKETHYEKALANYGFDNMASRLDNIKELKSIIREAEKRYFDVEDKKEILALTLDEIFLRVKTDDEIEKQNSVNHVKLMTIHSAKGLEFPIVFVVGMEDNIFPHYGALDNVKELEEERRLAYVAFTRAKDKLYISNSQTRMQYGSPVANKQSKFISEIDQDNITFKGLSRKIVTEDFMSPIEKVLHQIENVGVEYSMGEKVNHSKFGTGLIVEVDGEYIKIAFKAPHGIKKLLSSHPSITKV